jgi:DNA excision repair protein ERCC-3
MMGGIKLFPNPLVVQENSRNILVFEYLDPNEKCSETLIQIADLLKAPEEVTTFELTPYSLWTAAAKGIKADFVTEFIMDNSQNIISDNFINKIRSDIRNFGALEFVADEDMLILNGKNEEIINQIKQIEAISSRIISEPNNKTLVFHLRYKTEIKKILFEYDLFIKDSTCYSVEHFDFNLLPLDSIGNRISLKDFQQNAVNAYLNFNLLAGGGGTIVMPPSSGKTIVALKIMQELKTTTLIITENTSSLERWLDELHIKTDVANKNVGVFEDHRSEIKPITLTTYQNASKNCNSLGNFGFIIYDDAHKIPTENNEKTTSIEANKKLALAATLARSDNNGKLVLSLVGPKWYEILPRTLIEKDYQVPVNCYEIRVPLQDRDRNKYISRRINNQEKRKLAANNPLKLKALEEILKRNNLGRILVLSYYIDQSTEIGQHFDLPVFNSKSNQNENFIEEFNNEDLNIFVATSQIIEKKKLEKVDVLISTSYQQGSIREEYLRVGKVLPKENGKQEGMLISLITSNTLEEWDYSIRRRSLINQGFRFKILSLDDLKKGGV